MPMASPTMCVESLQTPPRTDPSGTPFPEHAVAGGDEEQTPDHSTPSIPARLNLEHPAESSRGGGNA